MAAAVANLEIGFGIDSGLLEFAIRYELSAGRVDVAKCKLLSHQVAERINRRVGAGDEDRMILQIRTTPDKRDDSVLVAGPDIHQRAQAGEIVRPVGQVGNGLAVEVGSCQNYRPPHGLREIGLQRRSLCRSQPVKNQANGDWPVDAIKRYAEQSKDC